MLTKGSIAENWLIMGILEGSHGNIPKPIVWCQAQGFNPERLEAGQIVEVDGLAARIPIGWPPCTVPFLIDQSVKVQGLDCFFTFLWLLCRTGCA